MDKSEFIKQWEDFELLFEALKDKAAKLKVALGSFHSPAISKPKEKPRGLTEAQKAKIISRRRMLVYKKIANSLMIAAISLSLCFTSCKKVIDQPKSNPNLCMCPKPSKDSIKLINQ